MPFPPPSGRCVHCLGYHEVLTWDHVFPEAWYPDSTPENLEKWKIPSCAPCNAAHGASENELMIRLGLCLDPEFPASMGVVPRAVRAVDPSSGKNSRDAAARSAKQRKIFARTSAVLEQRIAQESIYPGFGPTPGIPETDQIPVLVSKHSIERLAEKIVRGLTYLEDGRFIEPTHVIEAHVLHEQTATEIREMLARYGKVFEREPALLVERAVTPEDGVSSFYRIEIWGRFRVYASVVQRSHSVIT